MLNTIDRIPNRLGIVGQRASIALAVAFALTCGPAFAHKTHAASTVATPSAAPVEGDRAAVTAIVTSAVAEVKLCGLAIERSHDAEVRSLCRKASADNARTAISGMQLAQSIGATAATLQLSAQARAELDALERYSGLDFDREFLLNQIEADENDENNVRYDAEVATDSAVKHYESTVLPKIENSLLQAESALRRVSEAAP